MPAEVRPHILVVDDDPAVREALGAALGGPYVVHAAATGEGACALLRARPIEAIVLDIRLGAEHGLDLVAPFRARSPAPILILTGHSTEELAIRALWAGVRGYLKKPTDLHAVRAAIARLIPPPAGSRDPLEQVRARLAQDVHLAVSIEELAQAADLNPDYLRQAFTDRFGLSPHAYRKACRMQWAARRLRRTGLPIKVVGLETGFPNGSAFSAAFSRFHGVSPETFRTCQGPDSGESGSPMSSGNEH